MGTMTASVKATMPTLNHAIVAAELNVSSSYASGGDSIDPTILGLSRVDYIIAGGCDDAGFHAFYDDSGGTMLLYDEDNASGVEAQVANTTDVSAVRVSVLAVGKE